MNREMITLVFADGTRFSWDTGNLGDAHRLLKLQRKKGDPIEVIGDGRAAQHLRERYAIYNADKKGYKADVLGNASELMGSPKEEIKRKWNQIKGKIGILRKVDEALK